MDAKSNKCVIARDEVPKQSKKQVRDTEILKMRLLRFARNDLGNYFQVVKIILSLLLLVFILPFSANAQIMTDYTCYPVFTSTDVTPNVLFVIDSSSSMHCTAYPDSPGDDSGDSHIDDDYDSNTSYYGYFDADSQYAYQNDRFESDAGGDWNGNFLNWMTTRRVDVAKKVLVGGRYDSCGSNDCLKGEDRTIYTGPDDNYCYKFRKKYNNPQDDSLSPTCNSGTCYYGIKDGKIYFDDDSNPYSGPKGTYNMHILQGSEPTGLIQAIASNARLGVEYYYPAFGSNYSGKVDVPIKEKRTNTTEVINSIRNYEAGVDTPLCRALYTAIGYYKQDDSYKYSGRTDAFTTGVQEEDPFWYEDLGRYVRCGKNFVVMISDGQPVSDGGVSLVSDSNGNGSELDELALWTHKESQDLRTDNDLDGNQTLDVYMVFAFGQGGSLMKETAKNGGFIDKDDDNQPDGDMTAGNGDAGNEFDEDDDGIPDTYFEAEEGYELERELFEAMTEILKRASSGTAVSVLSTSSEGEGSLFQAFFKPAVYEGFREIKWVGYLNALWVDPYGNLREDTNDDGALIYDEDVIIRFAVDEETGDTEIARYHDADADGMADIIPPATEPAPYETVPLDELNPIWEAGEKLALRDVSERTIKTWIDIDDDGVVDAGEFIDFDTGSASTLRPFLDAADDTEAANIISFIRGESVTSYRDRNITVNSVEHVWKLGDIVYSTPTVVGKPMEKYNQYYSDVTYGQFFTEWEGRGVTTYVGANDGMLHAFKAGTFTEGDNPTTTDKEEHGWYSATEDPVTTEALGDERWAYIPYNLLPHLKWLADPDYTHVFYVDLKPKVSDVRIFTADADHPNGWGTILIGGMRLGGGEYPLIEDFDGDTIVDPQRTFRSAYFVLDITVPDSPVLLGEFTDANLAFTTSYPAIVRLEASEGFQNPEDDKWFTVVGSGPTDCDGNSDQNGYVFVVDLDSGQIVKTFQTSENNAFMASPITLDINLNYNVDGIYIGETYDDSGIWKGNMYRISSSTGGAGWTYQLNANSWVMTKLLSSTTPVTASATASIDEDDNIWIYFGSGRYYDNSDQTDTSTQYFYGIKEPCPYGGCDTSDPSADEVAPADLYDATSIVVLTNQEIVGATATTWDTFVDEVQAEDGWYINLDTGGERVLNRPSVLGGLVIFPTFIPDTDICNYGGTGKFYALYYETGTAYYKDVMGTETYGDDKKCLKSIDLGQGVTSEVGLHVGKKATGTGFIQQSTGAVEQIEVTPAFNIKSGIIGWKQY